MDRDTTGAYKEIYTLYCPTCGKPKDEVIKALQDTGVVLRCLNCDTDGLGVWTLYRFPGCLSPVWGPDGNAGVMRKRRQTNRQRKLTGEKTKNWKNREYATEVNKNRQVKLEGF